MNNREETILCEIIEIIMPKNRGSFFGANADLALIEEKNLPVNLIDLLMTADSKGKKKLLSDYSKEDALFYMGIVRKIHNRVT